MLLESVQCPNCGSPEVAEPGVGSLVCSFCGSRLRVVRGSSGHPLATLADIKVNTEVIAKRTAIGHLIERLGLLRALREHLRSPGARMCRPEALSAMPQPMRDNLQALGNRMTSQDDRLRSLESEAQALVYAAERPVLQFERQHPRGTIVDKNLGRWLVAWALCTPVLAVVLLLAGLSVHAVLLGGGAALVAIVVGLFARPIAWTVRRRELKRHAADVSARVKEEYGPRLREAKQLLSVAHGEYHAAVDEAQRWVADRIGSTEARIDELQADMDRLAREL